MYDIKELTMEHHKDAERQDFVRILMSGNINKQLYACYLYNQLACYSELEKHAQQLSLFKDLNSLPRSEALHYDYNALWNHENGKPPLTESTNKYIEHIKSISESAEKLYAHIYVRHLGDLSGGQMIRKKTPGPNRYYRFTNTEVIEYKRIVKERVNMYMNIYQINVLAEARYCFESATMLFKEMKEMHDLGNFN